MQVFRLSLIVFLYRQTLTEQTKMIQIVAAFTERTLTKEQRNMFLGSQRLSVSSLLSVCFCGIVNGIIFFVMTGSNCYELSRI